MNTSNSVVHYGSDTQLVSGIEKHLGKSGTIVLGGKKYTAAELVKILQGRISNAVDVVQARAEWKAALARYREEVTATRDLVLVLKSALRAHFHGVPGALDDLGLTPRKRPRALTAEEKLAAVAKAKATREARHTMGKRQRRTVHGVTAPAPAVVVAPAVGPPSPVTSSSAAATPSGAVTNGAA